MRSYRRFNILAPIMIAMFLPGVVAGAPLRIAYSAISGAMATLWVAQEAGYFKREALIRSCFTSVAALYLFSRC